MHLRELRRRLPLYKHDVGETKWLSETKIQIRPTSLEVLEKRFPDRGNVDLSGEEIVRMEEDRFYVTDTVERAFEGRGPTEKECLRDLRKQIGLAVWKRMGGTDLEGPDPHLRMNPLPIVVRRGKKLWLAHTGRLERRPLLGRGRSKELAVLDLCKRMGLHAVYVTPFPHGQLFSTPMGRRLNEEELAERIFTENLVERDLRLEREAREHKPLERNSFTVEEARSAGRLGGLKKAENQRLWTGSWQRAGKKTKKVEGGGVFDWPVEDKPMPSFLAGLRPKRR
jgi:hypothetical protein